MSLINFLNTVLPNNLPFTLTLAVVFFISLSLFDTTEADSGSSSELTDDLLLPYFRFVLLPVDEDRFGLVDNVLLFFLFIAFIASLTSRLFSSAESILKKEADCTDIVSYLLCSSHTYGVVIDNVVFPDDFSPIFVNRRLASSEGSLKVE